MRQLEKIAFDFGESPLIPERESEFSWTSGAQETLESLCRTVVGKNLRTPKTYFTPSGSFWCSDMSNCSLINQSELFDTDAPGIDPGPGVLSWVLIPIDAGNDCTGLMSFGSSSSTFFLRHQVGLLEQLVQAFGVALTHRQLQWELRERIKELSCLYDIAKLVTKPGISLDEILGEATELLPPGWLHPEVTVARITVDDTGYATPNFDQAVAVLRSDIVIQGERRGQVEVGYTIETPDLDEGPFLQEERHLVDAEAGGNMSQCKDRKIGALLHAYELRQLSTEETDRFEKHLLACDHCFNEAAEFDDASYLLTNDADLKSLVSQAVWQQAAKPSLWTRAREVLWPQTNLLLKPALAYFVIALLLIPAYRGFRQDGDSTVTIPQSMVLTGTRSMSQSRASATEPLVLMFRINKARSGDIFRVEVTHESGAVAYTNNAFDNFDDREMATLLFGGGSLEAGVYNLTIFDPVSDTLRLEYRFVVE